MLVFNTSGIGKKIKKKKKLGIINRWDKLLNPELVHLLTHTSAACLHNRETRSKWSETINQN